MQLWQQYVMNVLGAGIGTTLVGFLFNYTFNCKLEAQRDLFGRASRLHERQIDVLSGLYEALYRVQGAFQLTAPGLRIGVPDEKTTNMNFEKTLKAAHDRFIAGRLLIFPEIEALIDVFFTKCFNGKIDLYFAGYPGINGHQRAARWDAVSKAIEDIPKLLEEIKLSSRAAIDGTLGSSKKTKSSSYCEHD